MQRDPVPSSDSDASLRPRFVPLAAWCRERGFTLERRSPSGRSYALSWRDAATRRLDTEKVATLAAVAPLVEEKIARGASRRPGVWHLYWSTANLRPGTMPWCRWRRWVHVSVIEGDLVGPAVRQNGQTRADPTPYSSAEACLAASALLGLELGGRLCLSALVTPAGGGSRFYSTPEYTQERVKELILDYVRGSAPAESPNVKEIAKRLQLATSLERAAGEREVERLLENGHLEWACDVDANGAEHTFLTVRAGGVSDALQ